MSGSFSSSDSTSNQAAEGTENIGGSEFSTGGNHSVGMSSSSRNTNQAHLKCHNKYDVDGRPITNTKNTTDHVNT